MRALVALVALPGLIAQAPVESELLRRIRTDDLETPRLRRADDGTLEIWALLGHLGREDGFTPLLGADLREGIANSGTWGMLTLWLQGGGDLLAMTGAEFHLRALGLDTSDTALRQHLMRPWTSAGASGRAELLDRLVIVDLLHKRGCRAAGAELTGLLNRKDTPEVLRRRARAALATFDGKPIESVRHRLDPTTLPLPEQLDLAVVVDHARLPDMTGVMAQSRRFMALAFAPHFALLADDPTAMSALQRLCLRNPELPFALVHGFGNIRLDHSCTSVTLRLDAFPPFTLCYQAAGEFEADVWVAAESIEGPPLVPEGKLVVTHDRLTGHTGGNLGKPAPAVAERLLTPSDAAVRVVVPEGSKVGELAAQADLSLRSAELVVTFHEQSAIVQIDIDAGSDHAASAWRACGEKLRRLGRDALAADVGRPFRDDPELAAACRAVLGTEVKVAGARVTATAAIPIMRASGWEALVVATGHK